MFCIAIIHIQLYTNTCGNIINYNDEWTHFLRKIYLSHFIIKGCERVVKGLSVRGELETEQTATYWPPVPLTLAALLFSFYRAAQPGVLRAQALCWELVLNALNGNSNFNCNWLQLTQAVCVTWLYNCLTPTCILWVPQLHWIQPVKVIPWYLQPDAPVSWLTARSKVNMLHMISPSSK